MAKLGKIPGEPYTQQLFANKDALLFIDRHLHELEESRFRRWGQLLGVFWDEDSLEALFAHETDDRLESLEKEAGLESWVKKRERPKEILTPLALVLQPGFVEALKKNYTSRYGISAPGFAREAGKAGQMIDLSKWSPEDFVQFVGSVVAPVAPRV